MAGRYLVSHTTDDVVLVLPSAHLQPSPLYSNFEKPVVLVRVTQYIWNAYRKRSTYRERNTLNAFANAIDDRRPSNPDLDINLITWSVLFTKSRAQMVYKLNRRQAVKN
jgi:hypothetical protein